MLRGEQYSTIFKDTRDSAKVTVTWRCVLSGKEFPSRHQDYNNASGGSVLSAQPLVSTRAMGEALIDSGYYKALAVRVRRTRRRVAIRRLRTILPPEAGAGGT